MNLQHSLVVLVGRPLMYKAHHALAKSKKLRLPRRSRRNPSKREPNNWSRAHPLNTNREGLTGAQMRPANCSDVRMRISFPFSPFLFAP